MDKAAAHISEENDARKNPIDGESAWKLLSGADVIYVAAGKKTKRFSPTDDNKEEIMKSTLGRAGTLRAPALRSGTIFHIGYNEEMYATLLKS